MYPPEEPHQSFSEMAAAGPGQRRPAPIVRQRLGNNVSPTLSCVNGTAGSSVAKKCERPRQEEEAGHPSSCLSAAPHNGHGDRVRSLIGSPIDANKSRATSLCQCGTFFSNFAAGENMEVKLKVHCVKLGLIYDYYVGESLTYCLYIYC